MASALGSSPVHSGVRQGCPLSPYLFILAMEIVAINIRNNANSQIKGIKKHSKEVKISLYADDTTFFVREKFSAEIVVNIFKHFYTYSGLKLNLKKSECLLLGKNKSRDEILQGITCSNSSVHTLGISFSSSTNDMLLQNYKNKLKDLRDTLCIWKKRKLSLQGKVLVIMSLALSKLVYLFSVLETPNWVIKEAERLTNEFLWDNKKHKIKHSTIISDYSN